MQIDLYNKLQNPIDAIDKMGEWFASGGMFKCTRKEQGKMLALICVAEGKSPTQIHREYHVMDDGTIAPKARNVHARFLAEGGDIEWILTGEEERDWEKIVAKATFKWKDKKPLTFSFSTLDARKQGLRVDKEGGAWRKNPARMCRARLIGLAVDFFAPHITMGAPDESDDDNTSSTPATTITMQVNTEPVPAPAKPAKAPEVIDVSPSVMSATEAALYPVSAAAPAPAAEPTAAPAPAPAAAAAEPGQLSNEVLTQVENAIGAADAPAALRWLRANGHLRHDHGLDRLSEKMAARIIKHSAKFLESVRRNATPAAA